MTPRLLMRATRRPNPLWTAYRGHQARHVERMAFGYDFIVPCAATARKRNTEVLFG